MRGVAPDAVAAGEKLYKFPSWVIVRGGNPVICWLSRIPECLSDGKIQKQNAEKNFTVRVTVKFIRWGR